MMGTFNKDKARRSLHKACMAICRDPSKTKILEERIVSLQNSLYAHSLK